MEKKQSVGTAKSYGCKIPRSKQWHSEHQGPFPETRLDWYDRSTEWREKKQRQPLFLASGSVSVNYNALSYVSSVEENFI